MTNTEDLSVTMIGLDRLQPSPTQPRKRFNQEKLEELTASMLEHGFTLSAITVRPLAGGSNGSTRFEIVTGERRTRAAKAAGIKRVPCFVRQLSDEAVMEQQLIENLQRDDLTAIEEAESYKAMLALKDAGKPVYTVERLAKKIGKSERTIFERLALCGLDDATKREVESGRLHQQTALLIGRIPNQADRVRFAKMVLHPQKEEGPLSARKTLELLHKEFVRDLRSATFDQTDPELVPVELEDGRRVAGGACVDCPLRAGNAPAAGDDKVKREKQSTCMNPGCFERKTAAEWAEWQAENTKPEKKRLAMSAAQCAKLFAYGNQISSESGLVDLKEHPDSSDLKPGEESPGTWSKLTAGAEIQVFVVRDRFMKTRELVKRDVAIEAARTINKHTVFKTAQRERPKGEETRKAEEKKKEGDREKDQAVIDAVLGEIRMNTHLSARPMVEDFLAFLADREIEAVKPTPEFLKRYHLPIGGTALPQLQKLDAAALVALLVDLIVSEGGYCTDVHDDDKKWLRNIFDIDHKAIEKKVTDERSSAAVKKGAKKSSKK